MKFYRVHLYSETEGSFGFEWYTSKRDAEGAANDFIRRNDDQCPDPEIDEVEIKPTKKGILYALECYGTHPDNG